MTDSLPYRASLVGCFRAHPSAEVGEGAASLGVMESPPTDEGDKDPKPMARLPFWHY